jgi:hypothetical protein
MELLLSLITTILMAYQVTVMPATQNAKYTFSVDGDNRIIRMNTQDGTMHYCKTIDLCDQTK